MSTAPGGRMAARAAERAEQAAEVSWFDARAVTLGAADLAELDARESARAAAFVFPADRHRYQVAHVMLRRVLAGHLGAEPGGLTFGRQRCPACGGPSGKPVLTGPALSGGHPRTPDGPGIPRGADADGPLGDGPGLFFSLAHSGDAVAIAVARGPVGIDVEREATGCVCSLASAMHADDAARVEALPEPDRHVAVIRWWVRAEAVLKCAGTGIAHGMDAFPVLGAAARGQVPAGCSFTALSAPKGYQAALALPGLRLIRYRWGPVVSHQTGGGES
jgi:4'-phosphopantetheinyl transferase